MVVTMAAMFGGSAMLAAVAVAEWCGVWCCCDWVVALQWKDDCDVWWGYGCSGRMAAVWGYDLEWWFQWWQGCDSCGVLWNVRKAKVKPKCLQTLECKVVVAVVAVVAWQQLQQG